MLTQKLKMSLADNVIAQQSFVGAAEIFYVNLKLLAKKQNFKEHDIVLHNQFLSQRAKLKHRLTKIDIIHPYFCFLIHCNTVYSRHFSSFWEEIMKLQKSKKKLCVGNHLAI